MKPVIKKQTFYSMLLMRDDSEVRSFRVRNTTLRVILAAFAFFVLLGISGIAIGAHYWKRYASIIDDYRQNERELTEMRLQLQQLSGMEKIAMASSCPVPLLQNNEVGAEAPTRQNNATLPIAISGLATPGNDAAFSNATRTLFNATAMTPSSIMPQSRDTSQTNRNGTQSPEDAAPVLLPLISGKESPLRINNYSGRILAQQRLRVKYDLSTAPDMQDLVSGTAKYAALFTNGTRLDLELQPPEDTRFSIRSLKPVNDILRLPQGYSTRNVKNIDITLELDDGRKFRDSFSITR